MKYKCAFRFASTFEGKQQAPDRCRAANCTGVRNIKRGQSMKRYCSNALPDPETIMKIHERPKTPLAKEAI